MNDALLDVLEVLKQRENDAYREWRDALDGLVAKQVAWERARRAYHEELTARARLSGGVR